MMNMLDVYCRWTVFIFLGIPLRRIEKGMLGIFLE